VVVSVLVVTHEKVYLEAGSFINAFDAYRQAVFAQSRPHAHVIS
jgi:hypothetical protein